MRTITLGNDFQGQGDTMQRQLPPYRADVVGSFLRPDAIKTAREQYARGDITATQLRLMKTTPSANALTPSAPAA